MYYGPHMANYLKPCFRRHRLNIDKTQVQCAEELGCTDKYLSRVLNNKVQAGRVLADKIDSWSKGVVPWTLVLKPTKRPLNATKPRVRRV